MKYLLLLFPLTVMAGDPHHETVKPIYYNTVEQSIVNEVNRSALGIADLHYNLATKDMQWAASASTIDGNNAGKLGIGKKIDNVFMSITVGRENGHTGFGVSGSGKF